MNLQKKRGLKALLSKSVEWNIITTNPLSALKPLRAPDEHRIRYLEADEEITLLEALVQREADLRAKRASANEWRQRRSYPLMADLTSVAYADHLRPMVLLSLNTGLRRGELFSLKWSDVDIDRSFLTVKANIAKSGRTRHVQLNSLAVKVLCGWQASTHAESGLVFPNPKGEMMDNVKSSWQSVLTAAGITNFRWHDMRHHFASRLVMAGVDLNTVRELLGHADLKMTLRYAHLAPEHKAAAVEVLVSQKHSRGVRT